jgi:hypothetical protein
MRFPSANAKVSGNDLPPLVAGVALHLTPLPTCLQPFVANIVVLLPCYIFRLAHSLSTLSFTVTRPGPKFGSTLEARAPRIWVLIPILPNSTGKGQLSHNLAPDASSRSLLINEAVGPHG